MSKTLIGVVSYGGLMFLECFLRSVQETLTTPNTDVLVVVARPDDKEMKEFLDARGFNYIAHDINKGFPASCNDLYDAAFVHGDYDNLIFCGNDIVAMPGAIDAMIRAADTTDWEMICGSEFNSRHMWNNYPECRKHFLDKDKLTVNQAGVNSRLWELNKDFREGIEPDTLKDVRNFTLFKRSAFEKVGYDDVNFWSGGYFADNCTALRCHKTGVRAAGLKEAAFYHWWSRNIHQGDPRNHSAMFNRNQQYYVHKFGGPVNQERYELPFDGRGMQLTPEIFLKPELKIESREQEQAIINYWSSL